MKKTFKIMTVILLFATSMHTPPCHASGTSVALQGAAKFSQKEKILIKWDLWGYSHEKNAIDNPTALYRKSDTTIDQKIAIIDALDHLGELTSEEKNIIKRDLLNNNPIAGFLNGVHAQKNTVDQKALIVKALIRLNSLKEHEKNDIREGFLGYSIHHNELSSGRLYRNIIHGRYPYEYDEKKIDEKIAIVKALIVLGTTIPEERDAIMRDFLYIISDVNLYPSVKHVNQNTAIVKALIDLGPLTPEKKTTIKDKFFIHSETEVSHARSLYKKIVAADATAHPYRLTRNIPTKVINDNRGDIIAKKIAIIDALIPLKVLDEDDKNAIKKDFLGNLTKSNLDFNSLYGKSATVAQRIAIFKVLINLGNLTLEEKTLIKENIFRYQPSEKILGKDSLYGQYGKTENIVAELDLHNAIDEKIAIVKALINLKALKEDEKSAIWSDFFGDGNIHPNLPGQPFDLKNFHPNSLYARSTTITQKVAMVNVLAEL